MKKTIILISITFLTACIQYGQSLDKLDQKYGIGPLKLGSSKSSFSSIVEVGKTKDNYDGYIYKGSDFVKYSGYNIYETDLFFWDNKLTIVSVFILFDAEKNGYQLRKTDAEKIAYNLEQLYGPSGYGFMTSQTRTYFGTEYKSSDYYYWTGKKCRINIQKWYSSQSNDGENSYCFIILLTALDLEKIKLESEM